MSSSQSVILAYIPALHQGYVQLLESVPAPRRVLLVPAELAQKYGPAHKDLHGLPVEKIKQALESWQLCDAVEVADEALLQNLAAEKTPIVIPDEVITTDLAAEYLPENQVTKSSIFLRWDRKNATTPHEPEHHEITDDEFAQLMISVAHEEGQKSADWWRQVGAVAVKDKTIIAKVHNTHLPSEQQPNIEGDGRAQFHKGEHIEATTAIHAEAKLIAEAAASGTSLEGCELYLTDFPCPPCAKLVAHAGIKKIYYRDGYAVFDGERVLQSAGVEIVKVV